MKTLFKALPILSILLIKTFLACSQTDSIKIDDKGLDINNFVIDLNFSQVLKIKGEDLEKFPTQNLEEALNVWLFGKFPSKESLVYVVDGNVNRDLNAYSLNDIEEVYFVLNALTILNGLREQQLVVIKTRKTQNSGVKALGQLSLVNSKPIYNLTLGNLSESEKSELFHHYYIGGYKNVKNIHIGLSADYSKDVFPSLSNRVMDINPSVNRVRLNGFFNSKIGKNNLIDFTINYTPQSFEVRSSSVSNNSRNDKLQNSNSNVLSSALKFNQKFGSNIFNTIELSYNSFNHIEDVFSNTETNSAVELSESNYRVNSANFRIRDHFSHSLKFNNISIVTFFDTFFNWEDSEKTLDVLKDNQGNYSTSYNKIFTKDLQISANPGLSFYLKDYVNITAGISLNKYSYPSGINVSKKLVSNPFVSFGYDLSSIWSKKLMGFKIFGSYAESHAYLKDDQYGYYNYGKLSGFLTDIYSEDSYLKYFGRNKAIYNNTQFPISPSGNNSEVKAFLVGTDLPISRHLSFQYTFESRKI